MLRILVLTYQGDMAGSTYSIAYLCKGLAAKGHTIVVGLRKEALLYQLLANSNVIRVPMVFRSKIDSKNIMHIAQVVRQYNIQIINAQSSKDRYTAIFANWWYKLGAKVIHTRRQHPLSIGGLLQNTFYVKGTYKIVTVSHQLKQTFVQKGIPAKHIQVIYNGIPTQKFNLVNDTTVNRLRKQFNINPTDIVIGCVSRRKKQEQLVEAMQYLKLPNIKLLFVGIAPNSLYPYVQQYEITTPIIYAGKLSEQEAMNCYPLMQVQVLPSTLDGFGLVLVEAMGLGVPVVATKSQGIIDVLDEQKNGLWFEDGNAQQLAQKLQQVLTNKILRATLIKNGKQAANTKFSMKRVVQDYEDFFSRCITE